MTSDAVDEIKLTFDWVFSHMDVLSKYNTQDLEGEIPDVAFVEQIDPSVEAGTPIYAFTDEFLKPVLPALTSVMAECQIENPTWRETSMLARFLRYERGIIACYKAIDETATEAITDIEIRNNEDYMQCFSDHFDLVTDYDQPKEFYEDNKDFEQFDITNGRAETALDFLWAQSAFYGVRTMDPNVRAMASRMSSDALRQRITRCVGDEIFMQMFVRIRASDDGRF